jgi:hypothetical protein
MSVTGNISNQSVKYYQLEQQDLDNLQMLPCSSSSSSNSNGNVNNSGKGENEKAIGNGSSSSSSSSSNRANMIQAGKGKFSSGTLLTVPLRTEDEAHPSLCGALYRFTPKFNFYGLVLYATSDCSVIQKVITKSALIVVTDQTKPDWWFVYHQGVSGWVNITADMLSSKAVERVSTCKAYEDWSGRNYFLCNGRFILGSDAKFFL